MDKIITILQPVGLGDILFCQKIAYKLIEYGYEVYWPMTTYGWIKNYIKKDGLIWGNSPKHGLVLNLQNSIESNHPYDIMTCKYDMIGKTLPQLPSELHSINWSNWSDYLKIERDIQKENLLYYEILGLKDDEEYVFVNTMYGVNQSIPKTRTTIINKNLKTIELRFIDGYTLFDWFKVIENASEIHTADTSINYVIDILNLKSKILKLHPRNPDHTPKCLSNIFKTNWEWVV
jgi:hypothetical protein